MHVNNLNYQCQKCNITQKLINKNNRETEIINVSSRHFVNKY